MFFSTFIFHILILIASQTRNNIIYLKVREMNSTSQRVILIMQKQKSFVSLSDEVTSEGDTGKTLYIDGFLG